MGAKGLLLACLLGGCGFGTCPEGNESVLRSGTFRSETSAGALYPAPEIDRKTVVVDRQAGVVRISYTRNGKAVEERWKINGVTVQRY